MLKSLIDVYMQNEQEQESTRKKLVKLYEESRNHREKLIRALDAQHSFVELFPFLSKDAITELCTDFNTTKSLEYMDSIFNIPNAFEITVLITDTELYIKKDVEGGQNDANGSNTWHWDLVEVEDKIQEIKNVVNIIMNDRLKFIERALKYFESLK